MQNFDFINQFDFKIGFVISQITQSDFLERRNCENDEKEEFPFGHQCCLIMKLNFSIWGTARGPFEVVKAITNGLTQLLFCDRAIFIERNYRNFQNLDRCRNFANNAIHFRVYFTTLMYESHTLSLILTYYFHI